MACKRWIEKVDCYADGGLELAESAAFAEHLHGCPACAATVLEQVQMKNSLRIAGKRYSPSAQLRRKIENSVAVKPKGFFTPWRSVLIPALAVLIAAMLLSPYLTRERATRRYVYSELVDLHVATLASDTPVDVISTDRHTVKPWFQGKIPFTFNLPELTGSEFSLTGGRVAYLDQISGAHLIYRIRRHELSVFIFPERDSDMRSLGSGVAITNSFHSQTWTQNGLRYFVIGDVGAEDIQSLSKLLQSAS